MVSGGSGTDVLWHALADTEATHSGWGRAKYPGPARPVSRALKGAYFCYILVTIKLCPKQLSVCNLNQG
jgi:hypothetical protein